MYLCILRGALANFIVFFYFFIDSLTLSSKLIDTIYILNYFILFTVKCMIKPKTERNLAANFILEYNY